MGFSDSKLCNASLPNGKRCKNWIRNKRCSIGFRWRYRRIFESFPNAYGTKRRKYLSNPYIERSRLYSRSEEHTSELQSRGHLVCRLLHEKKNNKKTK